MPELEELEVTGALEAQHARKLLLDLTWDPSTDGNSNLCPRLHTIHLCAIVEGTDIYVFLEFIKSRRPMRVSNQHANPLRSVTLITEPEFGESDEGFLAELEVLRDEGVNIVIG
ncbi:hypothetical protein PILCRDRAFT_829960 [Piloderma croceum F 1598]|uniref:Uncharacterized protein n=1 Tax=Piloderma croceum (strain F 1598) TaxID=765440 RepID=A0A0C3EWN6_PILCF|nr:hypothetical protein PILCRDRAFT_829960 [Piloderma croceum F 1598]